MKKKSKKPFIIAEAAQGFEGDPLLARLLVQAAARAGADAVKFQLVYADEIATPEYKYYDLFKKLEMPATCWIQRRPMETLKRFLGRSVWESFLSRLRYRVPTKKTQL